MFLAFEIDSEKRNFHMFRPRIFEKLKKEIQKFRVGYLPEENENFEKRYFFYQNQRKIPIVFKLR